MGTIDPATRLGGAAALLTVAAAASTLGYMIIEDVSFFDALYMVVITISTVGYAETFELSSTGRVLTMGVILTGVTTLLYTAGSALELGIENLSGRRKELRMARAVQALRDHYIVAGFGRVGANTWQRLSRAGAELVVIEIDPERAAAASEEGALVVEGDATRDEVLEEAGIRHARALVACVRNDSDNLVIVLSAKAQRPELFVVSRATQAESESKLRMAGADRVVAPLVLGAQRLADLVLHPSLAEFLDLVVRGDLIEFRVEQLEVTEVSPLAGASLREAGIRERSGALVLAIEDVDGRLMLNPDPTVTLQAGQTIVGIGTAEQVERLEMLVNGRR